jgi:hypothetical protein
MMKKFDEGCVRSIGDALGAKNLHARPKVGHPSVHLGLGLRELAHIAIH